MMNVAVLRAGKLTEALAITDAHNGLPLDAPPVALHARLEKPEIAAGVRIGITKAMELPWRYGLKARNSSASH